VILAVSHRTTYSYAHPVSISHHVLHLTPRPTPHQRCHRAAIAIVPAPTVVREDVDYFGNPVSFVTLQESHQRLVLSASALVEVAPPGLPDPDLSPPWEAVAAGLEADRSAAGLDIYQYAFESPHTRARAPLADYARQVFRPGRPILRCARDLTTLIHREFVYDSKATSVATPLDEVFSKRRGVCQDFAHLEIACLRALGLAARYVSGYLMTRPPPGKPRRIGADASHAWLAVWVPGPGWVDLDPTNDLIPGEEHVTLAWGRDYGDVSPINGVIFGGGAHSVEVAVDVVPAAI
jgi:transglutaminase-like putative cysteine protease